MTDTVASLSVRVGADTSEAKQKLRELERLGDAFGRRMSGAFADAVFSGDGLSATLQVAGARHVAAGAPLGLSAADRRDRQRLG